MLCGLLMFSVLVCLSFVVLFRIDLLHEVLPGALRNSKTLVPTFGAALPREIAEEFQSSHRIYVARRSGSNLRWNRTWSEYADGFSIEPLLNGGDGFAGLKTLHALTSVPSKLLFRFEFDSVMYWAYYGEFVIDGQSCDYRIRVGKYEGSAGDSLAYHNNRGFATFDHGSRTSCSKKYGLGGWWFHNCHRSNLFGEWESDQHAAMPCWKTLTGYDSGVDFFEMIILHNDRYSRIDVTKAQFSFSVRDQNLISFNFTEIPLPLGVSIAVVSGKGIDPKLDLPLPSESIFNSGTAALLTPSDLHSFRFDQNQRYWIELSDGGRFSIRFHASIDEAITDSCVQVIDASESDEFVRRTYGCQITLVPFVESPLPQTRWTTYSPFSVDFSFTLLFDHIAPTPIVGYSVSELFTDGSVPTLYVGIVSDESLSDGRITDFIWTNPSWFLKTSKSVVSESYFGQDLYYHPIRPLDCFRTSSRYSGETAFGFTIVFPNATTDRQKVVTEKHRYAFKNEISTHLATLPSNFRFFQSEDFTETIEAIPLGSSFPYVYAQLELLFPFGSLEIENLEIAVVSEDTKGEASRVGLVKDEDYLELPSFEHDKGKHLRYEISTLRWTKQFPTMIDFVVRYDYTYIPNATRRSESSIIGEVSSHALIEFSGDGRKVCAAATTLLLVVLVLLL